MAISEVPTVAHLLTQAAEQLNDEWAASYNVAGQRTPRTFAIEAALAAIGQAATELGLCPDMVVEQTENCPVSLTPEHRDHTA